LYQKLFIYSFIQTRDCDSWRERACLVRASRKVQESW